MLLGPCSPWSALLDAPFMNQLQSIVVLGPPKPAFFYATHSTDEKWEVQRG